MTPNEYQALTAETELYTEASMKFLADTFEIRDMALPSTQAVDMLSMMYCCGKLNGEAGEAAEIVFKAFRGNGQLSGGEKFNLQKELGDILWYVARMSDLIGVPLEDIMKQNIEKLSDRKDRGVLHGYGDER